MPTYTFITQGQFLTALAARLYDASEQLWSHAEKTLYLQEALRTWNALTSFWRGDFPFNTVNNQTWYDVTTLTNTLRPLTLHDTDLYTMIQYHLLEATPGTVLNPWTGVSTQFTAADLVNAVQARRDELISLTCPLVTRRVVGAAAGRITLPDTVIDIRRIAYLPQASFGQVNSIMWPEDTWAEQAFQANYPQLPAGTPLSYLQSVQAPISFDTDRAPAFAGSYEILTTEAGPLLSVNLPNTLSVPDDWTHVIKWGALATLLSRDANARDIPRAQYCEQRYQLGVALLRDAAAILALRVTGVAMQVDSLRSADLYRTSWQVLAPGIPDSIYVAGLNLFAFAPTPSTGPFGGVLTVVQNAPIPASDSDPVQLSRDDLDVLLDYCTHLAMFKQGGAEFTSTMPLLTRFMQQAVAYQSRLMELGEFTRLLLDVSQLEAVANPRALPIPTAPEVTQ